MLMNVPTPCEERVRRHRCWQTLHLRVHLGELGEVRLPGHAQKLLPLGVGQARRQQGPPLLAELVVGAREPGTLLATSRRRSGLTQRGRLLRGLPTAAATGTKTAAPAGDAAAAALPLQRRRGGRCMHDGGRGWCCHLEVSPIAGWWRQCVRHSVSGSAVLSAVSLHVAPFLSQTLKVGVIGVGKCVRSAGLLPLAGLNTVVCFASNRRETTETADVLILKLAHISCSQKAPAVDDL
mmetsp:Transcript_15297/g.37935  ORF Transcript_15297/g.37935 Transcript_15297/m.37935 type:complete len:237 (+) Transcript_15297:823-1533(+)